MVNFLLSQGWKVATVVVVAIGSVMGSATAVAVAKKEIDNTISRGE